MTVPPATASASSPHQPLSASGSASAVHTPLDRVVQAALEAHDVMLAKGLVVAMAGRRPAGEQSGKEPL